MIILETLEEGYSVLNNLYKILSRYGYITRGDLYREMDTPVEFADEKRGWRCTDLSLFKITKFDKQYQLELPPEEDIVFSWTKRAIEHGAGIVPRVLTEQYIAAMKALGFDSVQIDSDGDLPQAKGDDFYSRNQGNVYCGREGCIVDSDEKTQFYSVHRGDCPLNEVDRPNAV